MSGSLAPVSAIQRQTTSTLTRRYSAIWRVRRGICTDNERRDGRSPVTTASSDRIRAA